MAKRMMYSVETLPRMDAEIKRKVDLHTDQTIKGKITFEQQPNMPEGNLNGTNYLMVYGVGTPAENGAELLAAYEAAKAMPRYLGMIDDIPTTLYKGQTHKALYGEGYYKMLVDYTGYPPNETGEYSIFVTEAEAKSVRTTVIVAPGEYDFGATAFRVNSSGINIVSLTGNSDVIISSKEESSKEENSDYGYTYGIKVTANDILIKGINCRTNTFYIANSLDNLICEHCIGGNYSFGGGRGIASGTFNNCRGGNYSFGGDGGTVSGTFNNCTGLEYSFGSDGGTVSGVFNNCRGGNFSFGIHATASGTFNNCVGGNYSFGSDGGTVSGVFNNCTGGGGSFGRYGIIKESARLYYTRLTSGTFPTPVAGGRLILCIDGNNNIVTI